MRRTTTVVVLAGCVALLAAGCSGDKETVTIVTTVEAATTEEATTEETATGETTTEEDEAEPTGSGGALGSARGDLPETRIRLTRVERTSEGTVTVEFTFVNDSVDDFQFAGELGGDGSKDYGTVGGAYLTDEVNRKKYFVLRDESENCVCSTDLGFLDAGASADLFASFPAPPADVDTVTFVLPHFTPIDNVPIS